MVLQSIHFFMVKKQVISFCSAALATVIGNVIFLLIHFDMHTLVQDMYVCMYVCMYVRTYARPYICIYVSIIYNNGVQRDSNPFVPQMSRFPRGSHNLCFSWGFFAVPKVSIGFFKAVL